MLIRSSQGWRIREADATPEPVFVNRRAFVASASAGVLGLLSPGLMGCAGVLSDGEDGPIPPPEPDPTADLYPVTRNAAFETERPITPERVSSVYNNFIEFGSHKGIHKRAQALRLRPWQIRIDGAVEKPFTLDIDDLIRRMSLEERVYRHRCVEAWSMVVPWSGFPMRDLVTLARPLSAAKYVRLETFNDPEMARGQRATWYPWPYVEALTMAEATNELAFLVTGVYGKPLAKQFGAPLRLAVPWKYGFKSIKSIVRVTFALERPTTFWEDVQGDEYGFWANVNPKVPHERWSQATERDLATRARIPTRLFNGYQEWVAHLYKDVKDENLYM